MPAYGRVAHSHTTPFGPSRKGLGCHLAVNRNAAASIQNQALNALVFLMSYLPPEASAYDIGLDNRTEANGWFFDPVARVSSLSPEVDRRNVSAAKRTASCAERRDRDRWTGKREAS